MGNAEQTTDWCLTRGVYEELCCSGRLFLGLLQPWHVDRQRLWLLGKWVETGAKENRGITQSRQMWRKVPKSASWALCFRVELLRVRVSWMIHYSPCSPSHFLYICAIYWSSSMTPPLSPHNLYTPKQIISSQRTSQNLKSNLKNWHERSCCRLRV